MKHTLPALLLVLLAGCALTPPEVADASRRTAIATIPKCNSDKECEVKWSAARAWVLQNAGWKIQHVTSDYIETYNAIGGSTSIAVRVIKEPLQNGSYRFNATIWCDNMWGCIPEKWEALKNMHAYINASWNPQKP